MHAEAPSRRGKPPSRHVAKKKIVREGARSRSSSPNTEIAFSRTPLLGFEFERGHGHEPVFRNAFQHALERGAGIARRLRRAMLAARAIDQIEFSSCSRKPKAGTLDVVNRLRDDPTRRRISLM